VQLVCYTLFDDVSQEPNSDLITYKLYQEKRGERGEPGAKGILGSHLSRELDRMRASEREVARQILDALITSQGRRAVRSEADLVGELRGGPGEVNVETAQSVLNTLVDSRLLRSGKDEQDRLHYELAHDYLLHEIHVAPATQARKAAQEMLDQEIAAWRNNRELRIPADKLAIIEVQAANLQLDGDARTLLKLSRGARWRGVTLPVRGMIGGAIGFSLALLIALWPETDFFGLLAVVTVFRAMIGAIAGASIILVIDMAVTSYHGPRRRNCWLVGGATGAAAFVVVLLFNSVFTAAPANGLAIAVEGAAWGLVAGMGIVWVMSRNGPAWYAIPLVCLGCGLTLGAFETAFEPFGNVFANPTQAYVLLAGAVTPFFLMTAVRLANQIKGG
jgi:hypothetical protein